MKKVKLRLEPYRQDFPGFGLGDSNNGAFSIKSPYSGKNLRIIISDGEGWEHVSVSLENRTPNWEEMCFVKDMVFDDDETVIQYHPAKKDYVNCHPYCLHMWKPINHKLPLPPTILVGPKT